MSAYLGGTGALFYVYPNAGAYGLTFAMVLNFACYTYSKILVSQMALDRNSGKVLIWFHTLPWLQQAEKAIQYDIGEVYLDRNSAEVIYLLEKLSGDVTEFRGHLPLKHDDSRWPFLVYSNDSFTVKDNSSFLEALLFHNNAQDGDSHVENSDAETTWKAEKEAPEKSLRKARESKTISYKKFRKPKRRR